MKTHQEDQIVASHNISSSSHILNQFAMTSENKETCYSQAHNQHIPILVSIISSYQLEWKCSRYTNDTIKEESLLHLKDDHKNKVVDQ